MKKKYIIPEGTRDLVLGECSVKKRLQIQIEDILDKWGYKEVVTPTTEFYETFNSGFQNLREEDLYKFFDNKGKIMVLRPDMTIPIARVVGTKFKDVTKTMRFRYSSNVFRLNESLGGKKNEYTDCGVELIGSEAEESDLEIILTALEVLNVLDDYKYKFEIGNINFFNSAIKDLDLDYEERMKLAELIDRKSLKELEVYLDYLNVQDEYKAFFKKLPWLFGDESILDEGIKYAFNNELKESISYLRKFAEVLKRLGYEKTVLYDLGMVPRLNYYTGITFRGYVDGVGAAVLSGGRYDKLISTFGADKPAVGFSMNLDSVLDVIKDKNKELSESYIIYYNKENQVDAFVKSKELRNLGYVVNMYYKKDIKEFQVEKVGDNL
ncbi:MAG: ATP phosphoribosyltransferase regulatory subunit [Clostridium sp.]|nr:ATP phosphoribosyltransferase regulatory subunit [Clostridium sp.]